MEYSIEELAAAVGEKIDTIRFYQAKGLLPRPRRSGRSAIYGDEHAQILRTVREYQAQGFPLALIKRLLADGDSKSAALLEAVAGESGARSLTLAELAAESGVAEAILASLQAAGLLVPTRDGRGDGSSERYSEADVQMAKAGLTLLSQGFPLDQLLQLAVRHARAVESVCDGAIDLFDAHVRKLASEENGDGAADAAAVADTFRTLLPAVTTLVAVHFQRTLLHRALERLRERRESDDLAAAVAAVAEADSGRLEVRWT